MDLTDAEIDEARKDRIQCHEIQVNGSQSIIKRIESGEFGEEKKNDLETHHGIEIEERRNLEYAKTVPFVRSTKIPVRVPLYNVWNDCYFDEKKTAFITFRKFRDGLGPETLAAQKELNPDGIGVAFSWNDVRFKYGYPAIVNRGKDGHYRASLLCTLAEEMITDDLVIALYALQRDLGRDDLVDMGNVYYETEAPRRIGGKFFKLTEKEREIGLKYLPWLAYTNNPDIPWIKPYKIIPLNEEQVAKP